MRSSQLHLVMILSKESFFRMPMKILMINKIIQSFVSGGLICEIPTLWAYIFQTVWRKNPKISLKNQEFIRDSVKQIKKYDYRVKNRSYLRFCPAKSGFLDVNDERCLFLTQ
jgi:hypothetical protein